MDWIDASPHVIKDLDEAMDYVWESLTSTQQRDFRDAHSDSLWMFHHGLGRALRNQLGLWEEEKPAVQTYFEEQLEITHPDDISSTIIEALHAKVTGREYDLQKKKRTIKAYWEQAPQARTQAVSDDS